MAVVAQKQQAVCLSCTKTGESGVWICFEPQIGFLSLVNQHLSAARHRTKTGETVFPFEPQIGFLSL